MMIDIMPCKYKINKQIQIFYIELQIKKHLAIIRCETKLQYIQNMFLKHYALHIDICIIPKLLIIILKH